jgi:hypothetical protein
MHAQLQVAELIYANMKYAHLYGAYLQGANLRIARMQGAYLQEANLQGTDLDGAELQGANLKFARFDSSTQIGTTKFFGASCQCVDFTDTRLSQEQLLSMFGDRSTRLPLGYGPDGPIPPDRPKDWPNESLSQIDFQEAWRAWQAKIGFQPDENP